MNLKKTGRFLVSMKFALIILVIFALVCIAGSVIPQGNIEAVYKEAYPGTYGLILAIGLDDVFHSWWFVVLTLILCVNLLGCNLVHFPRILKNMRSKSYRDYHPTETLELREDPEELFRDMGFRRMECYRMDGVECRYGIRNRIGFWGAWLTHLGILIIMMGFALGQMFTVKYTVYGVPGQEKPVGDTGYALRIDDFIIGLREDDTVEQYTASLTLTNSATGEHWSGESSVNHPLDLQGYRLYQNSTGWAADVVIYENGEFLQQELLCAGEYMTVEDRPDLQIVFRSFYPDYVLGADGTPATASDRLNNPAYLYLLYYKGEVLGMNVLQSDQRITVSDYDIIFTNPRFYTLIQIKHDPFTWLAGIGGLVLLIALFIAFYLRTEELWAVADGKGFWRIYGRSRKGGLMYQDKLRERTKERNKE